MKKVLGLSILVLVFATLGVGQHAYADGPAPPNSHAFGRTLSGWMESYWTWLLGGDQDNQVRNVVFMPLPVGEPLDETCPLIITGELDVQLDAGEAFVLPMFAFNGESYVEDIPDDNPADFPQELFTSATVILKMDGKVVLDSSVDDLNDFYFDTIYFDEPIVYAEPGERDGVFADAAIWVKGIGFTYPPLSVGDHTMELYVDTHLDFGLGEDCTLQFVNTWNITVQND